MRHGQAVALLLSSCAAICAAQSSLPPDLARLVRIRERMNQNQARLPDYTCLETMDRARRPPHSMVISRSGGAGRFLRDDVLRLEVAEVNGKEFFAMPGAHNFAETNISVFNSRGMIGNGLFGGFAREIFDSSVADYQFAGETSVAGRPLVRYDFQVPLLLSNYQLDSLRGRAKVAYRGSIWADAKTLDTVRVDIQATGIPPELGIVTTSNRIDYAKVRIGAADVLLPQSAEMNMYLVEDWEFRNRVAFTHCKAYSAESEISFDAPSVTPSAAAPPPREIEIPAGLTLSTTLDTALDSTTSRLGDAVSAHIDADVRHKGAVLIPKGTRVTGRIRTFDRYTAPSHYHRIALEFYRFEFPRGPVRFFSVLERVVPPPGSGARLSVDRKSDLPGVGTFAIKGDTVQLQPGTRMVWKTSQYDETHSSR